MSSREKVFEIMEKAGILSLATLKGDKPKIRPVGFKMLLDNQIYFITSKHKDMCIQMLKNSNVEFMALADGEFMRYYGRIIFDDKQEDKYLLEKAFEIMPQLKDMFNEEAEPIIYHVDKATAEIRNVHGIKEVYDFLE